MSASSSSTQPSPPSPPAAITTLGFTSALSQFLLLTPPVSPAPEHASSSTHQYAALQRVDPLILDEPYGDASSAEDEDDEEEEEEDEDASSCGESEEEAMPRRVALSAGSFEVPQGEGYDRLRRRKQTRVMVSEQSRLGSGSIDGSRNDTNTNTNCISHDGERVVWNPGRPARGEEVNLEMKMEKGVGGKGKLKVVIVTGELVTFVSFWFGLVWNKRKVKMGVEIQRQKKEQAITRAKELVLLPLLSS